MQCNGGGGSHFRKKRYGGVRFKVISVTRGSVGFVKFRGKKHLNGPPRQLASEVLSLFLLDMMIGVICIHLRSSAIVIKRVLRPYCDCVNCAKPS